MTDQEMLEMIDRVSSEHRGQGDRLYKAVGVLMVGRIYGWRVMRLVAHRADYKAAVELFGDLKEILPERTQYSRKSVGLAICDKAGDYWAFITGTSKAMPLAERRQLD